MAQQHTFIGATSSQGTPCGDLPAGLRCALLHLQPHHWNGRLLRDHYRRSDNEKPLIPLTLMSIPVCYFGEIKRRRSLRLVCPYFSLRYLRHRPHHPNRRRLMRHTSPPPCHAMHPHLRHRCRHPSPSLGHPFRELSQKK